MLVDDDVLEQNDVCKKSVSVRRKLIVRNKLPKVGRARTIFGR